MVAFIWRDRLNTLVGLYIEYTIKVYRKQLYIAVTAVVMTVAVTVAVTVAATVASVAGQMYCPDIVVQFLLPQYGTFRRTVQTLYYSVQLSTRQYTVKFVTVKRVCLNQLLEVSETERQLHASLLCTFCHSVLLCTAFNSTIYSKICHG
jgi:hypothetical protein